MPIHDHVTEFAGLPVVDFPPPGAEPEQPEADEDDEEYEEGGEADHGNYPAALADPGAVAWRLRLPPYRPEESFQEYVTRFAATVDIAHVAALIVGCWGESYEDPGSVPRDLLVAHADRFSALRALFFGEFTAEESEISWIPQTDVTPLLAAFPGLEELVVRGGSGLEFPPVRHTALRRLVAQTGGLPRGVTAGVLASDLPALEHLELWFGVEDYGGTTAVDDLAPLLAGELFPALRHLGLRNSPWGDDLVRHLADAPVLDRLRTLDLSLGTLSDTGAQTLAAIPALHRLDRLDLHRNFLSERAAAGLRAALPGVALNLARQVSPLDLDGELHYYPEVTE